MEGYRKYCEHWRQIVSDFGSWLGSWVPGFGFRISGFWFRVSGSRFLVWGFGFREVTSKGVATPLLQQYPGSAFFRVSGSEFRVPGFRFRFRVPGCGLRVSGFGFRISGVRFWVLGCTRHIVSHSCYVLRISFILTLWEDRGRPAARAAA